MMAAILSSKRRSWNMSRISGRNTEPEVALKSPLQLAVLRFRRHDRTLPGQPDIVLTRHKAVIFADGCCWHRHTGCRNATMPSSRTEFWSDKLHATVERDERKAKALRALDWRVITLWECDIAKRPEVVVSDIKNEIREAR